MTNIEAIFGGAECFSWLDNDRQALRISVGGLRFSITMQHLEGIGIDRFSVAWVVHSKVYEALEAILSGLEWCSGIWDAQWAFGHGSLASDVEVLW